MANILKKHLHPLGGHILFWNLALLIFIKVILPQSVFPLATIVEQSPLFNSRGVVAQTNEARVQNGLPPLTPSYQLDAAASGKLEDMIANSYFAHVSPAGVTPWFWIKKVNYTYSVAGENLAIGFFTAKDTVDAWFKSSSHRANMLSPRYKDIGIAVGKSRIDGNDGIIVVQMFGRLNAVAIQSDQSIPTKSPVPVATLVQLKPQTVAAAETQVQPTAEEHAISTDIEIKPVAKPFPMANNSGLEINSMISSTNMVYSFYSFAMALISIGAFFLLKRRSNHPMMALRSLVSMNLFLLSLAIPATEVYIRSAIF